MTSTPTPQFEIPPEMGTIAARTLDQAKAAFINYMSAAQQTVSRLETQVQSSQIGAYHVTNEVLRMAEHNVSTAFEFAQKICQAKDAHEMLSIQTDFVQSQMKVLAEQVQDLGKTVSRAAI